MKRAKPQGWGPFQPGTLPADALDVDVLMRKHGIDREMAQRCVDRMRRETIMMNNRYQVNMIDVGEPFGPEVGMVRWLSIKRRDKAPIHDWRDLQRIKSELVGAECEAVELYPAESRVVDTANQFHLWVIVDPTVRLPLGFVDGRVVTGPEEAAAVGARQRAL
jgi:hypothetical protein